MTRVNVSASSTEHSLSGERLALLAIFARSEDELFGPAGTLARYANEGIDVSLVAAARTPALDAPNESAPKRDRTCACRASGIRRACLFDYSPDELARVAPATIEERVVRLIRELRPQVVVTFAPEGLSGDAANRLVSGAATAAFHHAGDAEQFPQHLNEGLGVHAAQKLYYCVLPRSVVAQWGITGLNAVSDEQITTTLDVSAQSEMMKNALYCQRYRAPDFIRRLDEQRIEWKTEYYILVESRLRRRARREKDLFAGLR